MTLRVGTRTSRLAQAQAEQVAERLTEHGHAVQLVPLTSQGDETRSIPIHRLGVAGAFTARLEHALVEGEVDLAVHSLKDLPLESQAGLTLPAILPRGPAEDALILRPGIHAPGAEDLPLKPGARVATSGPRRQSQLLSLRPDLCVVNVRGNVDTRLGKLRDGWFDALIMAYVAVDRADLDTAGLEVHRLDLKRFPCAPGQAAIAVQAREASKAAEAAAALDHPMTRTTVRLERAVLGELGGGCGLPLGAWAGWRGDRWHVASTYAGTAWTPADDPVVHRLHLDGRYASKLAREAADRLKTVDATPGRTEAPQPPAGRPVLVVASQPTTRKYLAHLQGHGLDVIPVPTRRFTPSDPATGPTRDQLDAVSWIGVTSQQAVDPLAALLGDDLPDAYVAAVGPATAAALQGAGLPCHLVAPDHTAASMADEMIRLEAPDPGRVLLALGDHAVDQAPQRLEAAGARVLRWTAYETEPLPVDLDDLDGTLPARAALVMSPRNAASLPLDDPAAVADAFVAIGPSTAQALREHGIDPIVPDRPTPEALLEVIP